jgi:hypothetical protein
MNWRERRVDPDPNLMHMHMLLCTRKRHLSDVERYSQKMLDDDDVIQFRF